MKKKSFYPRRAFIKTTLKGSAIIGLGLSGIGDFLSSCSPSRPVAGTSSLKTGFTQTPLPYSFDALEDIIDSRTMEIHYSKHAAAYAKNLQDEAAALSLDTGQALEYHLAKVSAYSIKFRNNAGGHYNHEIFWKMMRKPQSDNLPKASFLKVIEKNFGSLQSLKDQFSEAAKNRFGSGWAWLYMDDKKNLKTGSTPNQDNPLMDVSEIKGFPLLALDIWEHAYYLKYQNKRADYIKNWWSLVNWDYVQERYESISH